MRSDDTPADVGKPIPGDFVVLGFLPRFKHVQTERAAGADGSLAVKAVQTELVHRRFDGHSIALVAQLSLQLRPDAVPPCCHELDAGSQAAPRFRVRVGFLSPDTRGRGRIGASVTVGVAGDSNCNGRPEGHAEFLILAVAVDCVRDEDGDTRCESVGTLRVEDVRIFDAVPTTSVRIERSYRRSSADPAGLEESEVEPVRIRTRRDLIPTHFEAFASSAVGGTASIEVASEGGPEAINPSPRTEAAFLSNTESLLILDKGPGERLIGSIPKVN